MMKNMDFLLNNLFDNRHNGKLARWKFYRTSADSSTFRTQNDTDSANYRYTANKKNRSHHVRNVCYLLWFAISFVASISVYSAEAISEMNFAIRLFRLFFLFIFLFLLLSFEFSGRVKSELLGRKAFFMELSIVIIFMTQLYWNFRKVFCKRCRKQGSLEVFSKFKFVT